MEKNTKERGVVKWYDDEKGYGFIQPDMGKKDLFVHRSHIETLSGIVEKGDRVEFTIEEGPKGHEARHVQIVEQEVP
jgi:cold shock protein